VSPGFLVGTRGVVSAVGFAGGNLKSLGVFRFGGGQKKAFSWYKYWVGSGSWRGADLDVGSVWYERPRLAKIKYLLPPKIAAGFLPGQRRKWAFDWMPRGQLDVVMVPSFSL
jgi:hypothetical protein